VPQKAKLIAGKIHSNFFQCATQAAQKFSGFANTGWRGIEKLANGKGAVQLV